MMMMQHIIIMLYLTARPATQTTISAYHFCEYYFLLPPMNATSCILQWRISIVHYTKNKRQER